MNSKVLLLLLVLVAAGAFVYLDPMDLDLLGLKQQQVVAKPAAAPKYPAAVKPHEPAPKTAVAQTQKKAALPAAEPAAEPAAAKAKPAQLHAQPAAAEPPPAPANEPSAAKVPNVSAMMAAAPSEAKPVDAVPPQAMKPAKAKSKPPRPKNLDLRYCLELKTDAEIAKCAGE